MEEQDVVNQYILLNNELADHLDSLDNGMKQLDTLDQIKDSMAENPSIESLSLLSIAVIPIYRKLGLEDFDTISKESIGDIVKAGTDKALEIIKTIIEKFKKLWQWIKDQYKKLFKKKAEDQINRAEENKENIKSVEYNPSNEDENNNRLKHVSRIFKCDTKETIDTQYILEKEKLLEDTLHYFVDEYGELDPERLKVINMDKFIHQHYPCGYIFTKHEEHYLWDKISPDKEILNKVISPSSAEEISKIDTAAIRLLMRLESIETIIHSIEKNYHHYYALLKRDNPDSFPSKITADKKRMYINNMKEAFGILHPMVSLIKDFDTGILTFNELSIQH